MRPWLYDVRRQWSRKLTRGNDGTSLREQRNFSLSSVQFVGLILPLNSHAEISTRLYAPTNSSHNWPSEYALPPSLEWHVWSSSSGNNCHAVHRSLSSGALLCDGTVAFLPCPILSAKLYFTIGYNYTLELMTSLCTSYRCSVIVGRWSHLMFICMFVLVSFLYGCHIALFKLN